MKLEPSLNDQLVLSPSQQVEESDANSTPLNCVMFKKNVKKCTFFSNMFKMRVILSKKAPEEGGIFLRRSVFSVFQEDSKTFLIAAVER